MIMLDTMQNVMKNLTTNKKQIDEALAQSESVTGTFSPDVAKAIGLLIHTFGDAKTAAGMLTAVQQQEKLAAAASEVAALVAAVQVVMGDEELLDATQAQATANVEVANNPLPPAAGSSESPAADSTGGDQTEAAAASAAQGQV